MKRKILSVLLAFCMVVVCCPIEITAASVESTNISSLVSTARKAKGKTRSQLGLPNDAWCGYFAGYCINNSSIKDVLGKVSNSQCAYAIGLANWICNTKSAGTFYCFTSQHTSRVKELYPELKDGGKVKKTTRKSFTPAPGDFVEFSWSPDTTAFDHVGIVTDVKGNNITYIDGNSSLGNYTKVVSHTRAKTSANIIGYIRFNVDTSNPKTEISFSSVKAPNSGNVKYGTGYHTLGEIISVGSPLTKITGEVINSESKVVLSKTVSTNTYSYNLKDSAIDTALTFGKLAAGSYTLKYTAKTKDGVSATKSVSFKVVKPAPTAAKITGANWPTTLVAGQSFSIAGKISSDTNLTNVTAGVYTSASNGTMKIGKSANPNAKTYNLKTLDPSVKFGKLSAGSYYYRVTASNAAGKITLVNKKFTVMPSNGWYTLSPKCAPKTSLDVKSAGTANGTNVQIYNTNKSAAQQWKLTRLGNGYYTLISKCSGKALDVQGGNKNSGTNVQQYSQNGSAAQKWLLIDAGDGYFYLAPQLNTNLALDVYDAGTANGTNVWVYKRNNSNAQKWKLTLC